MRALGVTPPAQGQGAAATSGAYRYDLPQSIQHLPLIPAIKQLPNLCRREALLSGARAPCCLSRIDS